MMSRPSASKSWRTVVSAGVKNAASGMSSKPMTLRSSGTRTPASKHACSRPSDIWSLATNTAVATSSERIARPAASPDAASQSPAIGGCTASP